jgi:hypothetical protein
MFTAGELKQTKLFSILSDPEILSLAGKAADVRLAPGEWLSREGEPPYFHILVEGRLQMVKDVLGRPVDITHYEYQVAKPRFCWGRRTWSHCGRKQFAGLRAWSGSSFRISSEIQKKPAP